ncbi:hypothetical protein [uncultured Friedmanniella sp.]
MPGQGSAFVQLVELSDDEQLRDWLLGGAITAAAANRTKFALA